MERVGHLRMMNFTRPIMCIAQWFLMAPRRWNWLHWPSLRVWRPWCLHLSIRCTDPVWKRVAW
jgi:hypothetical protein